MNLLTKQLISRKDEYMDYLKTPKWKELKEARWEIDKYECVLCGNMAETVHHRRYPQVFGKETVDDLVSLCFRCHKNFHFPPTLLEAKKQEEEIKKQKTTEHIAKAQDWITNNHNGFNVFRKMALKLAKEGSKFGMKQLGEEVRWYVKVQHMDWFKVNNNYLTEIGRELIRQHPKLENFIETRKRKCDI